LDESAIAGAKTNLDVVNRLIDLEPHLYGDCALTVETKTRNLTSSRAVRKKPRSEASPNFATMLVRRPANRGRFRH
jgi:hypothetical protein